jgi:hypothetical protein
MLVALGLSLLAIVTAAVVAYGTDPAVAQLDKGMELIMLTRRLQWPLITLSLLSCIALLVLVIAGKRRAWWLLALAPVVALFMFRFGGAQSPAQYVLDNPPFVDASVASYLLDDDWIVGVSFAGEKLAFPYGALWTSPLVLHAVHDRRLILMWSPYANCATAYSVSRELRARELEIIGMPANGLLVYDRRLGQFISGITGHSPRGVKPIGVQQPVASVKTTWAHWRRMHPETRVLGIGQMTVAAPSSPVMPKYPMEAHDGVAPETRIALILAADPVAVASESVTSQPLNITVGTTPLFIYRDEATGLLRAFDRRIEHDLFPRFRLNADQRRRNVRFVDADTDTGWSAAGVAIDGDKELRGHQLKAIEVEDGLYWGVMKHWYPQLQLHISDPPQ